MGCLLPIDDCLVVLNILFSLVYILDGWLIDKHIFQNHQPDIPNGDLLINHASVVQGSSYHYKTTGSVSNLIIRSGPGLPVLAWQLDLSTRGSFFQCFFPPLGRLTKLSQSFYSSTCWTNPEVIWTSRFWNLRCSRSEPEHFRFQSKRPNHVFLRLEKRTIDGNIFILDRLFSSPCPRDGKQRWASTADMAYESRCTDILQ